MKLFEPEYQEQNHTYIEPGSQKRLPSVTQVCELAYAVRPGFYPQAAARGQTRHKQVADAINAHLQGKQPTQDTGPAAQAMRFLQEINAEPIYVEQGMYSPTLLYAGRVDLIARIGNNLTIIDWKGGTHNPVYNLQIAGYAIMAEEILGKPVRHGILVHWQKKYWQPLQNHNNPEHLIAQEHTEAFKACLKLWHWREQYLPA